MSRLDRIGVIFFGRLNAALMGLIGIACGTVYSFGGAVIDLFVSVELLTPSDTPGLSYGTVLAFGALIGMPLLLASAGFIYGVVAAVAFNSIARICHTWIASLIGPVRMDQS